MHCSSIVSSPWCFRPAPAPSTCPQASKEAPGSSSSVIVNGTLMAKDRFITLVRVGEERPADGGSDEADAAAVFGGNRVVLEMRPPVLLLGSTLRRLAQREVKEHTCLVYGACCTCTCCQQRAFAEPALTAPSVPPPPCASRSTRTASPSSLW